MCLEKVKKKIYHKELFEKKPIFQSLKKFFKIFSEVSAQNEGLVWNQYHTSPGTVWQTKKKIENQ